MSPKQLLILGMILVNSVVYGKYVSCPIDSIRSPINIPTFSQKTSIRYPAQPKVAINVTTYHGLSLAKFQKDDKDKTQISLDASFLGQIHITVYNYSIAYNAKKIYLKVFAEHGIEGNKADLEFQIMHELDPAYTYRFLKLHDIYSSFNMENYKYVGLSIRFSANRNIKSKDKFIEQLTQCDDGICKFHALEFVDLNQYFRKDYAYYKVSVTIKIGNSIEKICSTYGLNIKK